MDTPKNSEFKDVPDRLHQCTTLKQKKMWCLRALNKGGTLTDPSMWIQGVDNPASIIRALRKEGTRIKTCYVKTVDAAGMEHPRTLAWRLADQMA